MKITTSGRTIRAAQAMENAATRQPWLWDNDARNGRNTSWPVAALAVITPITVPWDFENQRLTTVALRL